MRHIVLPLPTGRFIIVQATYSGDVTMLQGAPIALRDPVLNGQSGTYTWKGRELPATLCYTYRDAYNHCMAMDDARPVSNSRFYAEELSRPLNY